MVMVLYGVLVFMYLQINDGVADLCILSSNSFHCNYGNCSHRITNTITGSKSYRDDIHNRQNPDLAESANSIIEILIKLFLLTIVLIHLMTIHLMIYDIKSHH